MDNSIAIAREEGQASYGNGFSLDRNPYSKKQNYRLWEAWSNAWLDAKIEHGKHQTRKRKV